jgi:hypothetical protein
MRREYELQLPQNNKPQPLRINQNDRKNRNRRFAMIVQQTCNDGAAESQ